MNIIIFENRKYKKQPLFFAFLSLICFLTTFPVFGQTTKDNNITLKTQNESLSTVLNKISALTEYKFFYDQETVDKAPRVSVDAKNNTIQFLLDQITAQTRLYFHKTDNTISVSKTPPAVQPPQETGTMVPTKTVTGNITDEKGEPIIGANVIEKGTPGNGTVTDVNGNFSLRIALDAILQVSYLGYHPQEIPTKGKSNFNIVLQEDTKDLDEIVVVGYAKMKKKDLTGSVATIKAEDLPSISVSKLSNILAGRLSGVYVTQNTGVPGVASRIRIRSRSSWNTSEPLFVIDGIIRGKEAFDMLDMNEVNDITVLKDAASAAIYGARSANGVILVSTKSGQEGKPTIMINSNYSIESPTTKPEFLSAHESMLINNVFWQKQTGQNWFGLDEIKMLDEGKYDYNYLDYLFRNPVSKNISASISGGTNNVRYYFGGSFNNNSGFLPNLNYKKYNIRANTEASITENLTVGLNLSTNYGQNHSFNHDYEDLGDWYGRLETFFFYIPIEIDGKLVNTKWSSSIASIVSGEDGYMDNQEKGLDALLNLKYNIPFIKGLSFKAVYSFNNVNNFGKRFWKKADVYDFETKGSTGKVYTNNFIGQSKSTSPTREFLENSANKTQSYQYNLQLSYAHQFGEHSIDAMAIYEQSDWGSSSFHLRKYDFPLIVKDQFFATSPNRINSDGHGNENFIGRSSYIGSANYKYKDRYLLSATLRADGSMLFAPGYRWGYFPSVSGAWVISQEPFFNHKFPLFLLFKIRGSLGWTGNDAVGGWQWQEVYYNAGQQFFGTSNQNFIKSGGIVNKKLTWEKSRAHNVGIDILTTHKLGLTLDYWGRYTYDILGSRIITLPTTFGARMPDENYGIVNSFGFESELSYNFNFGDLKFDTGVKFAYSDTKVKKRDYSPGALEVDIPVGKPLGYTATLVSTGIIRTQEELDALPKGYTINGAKPVLGCLNYEDVSGVEGVPDGKIDHYDRQIISKYNQATAPFSGGFNINAAWKNIYVNTFFQGIFGFQKLYSDNWGRNFPLDARLYKFWGDTWSSDNPNAQYPVIYGPGEPRGSIASSFWYKDGSYLRLKNFTVGYELTQKWLQKADIQKIKIYLNGTNLFYLSKFKYYDPEASTIQSYPIMKTWSLGLNLTL